MRLSYTLCAPAYPLGNSGSKFLASQPATAHAKPVRWSATICSVTDRLAANTSFYWHNSNPFIRNTITSIKGRAWPLGHVTSHVFLILLCIRHPSVRSKSSSDRSVSHNPWNTSRAASAYTLAKSTAVDRVDRNIGYHTHMFIQQWQQWSRIQHSRSPPFLLARHASTASPTVRKIQFSPIPSTSRASFILWITCHPGLAIAICTLLFSASEGVYFTKKLRMVVLHSFSANSKQSVYLYATRHQLLAQFFQRCKTCCVNVHHICKPGVDISSI